MGTIREQAISIGAGAALAALCSAAPALSATIEFCITLKGDGGGTGSGSIVVDPVGLTKANPHLLTSASTVSLNFGALTFSTAATAGEYWTFDEELNFIVGLAEDVDDGWVGFGNGSGSRLELTTGGADGRGAFRIFLGDEQSAAGTYDINRNNPAGPDGSDTQGGGGLPAVPLPATLPLLVAALGAIGLWRRRARS